MMTIVVFFTHLKTIITKEVGSTITILLVITSITVITIILVIAEVQSTKLHPVVIITVEKIANIIIIIITQVVVAHQPILTPLTTQLVGCRKAQEATAVVVVVDATRAMIIIPLLVIITLRTAAAPLVLRVRVR